MDEAANQAMSALLSIAALRALQTNQPINDNDLENIARASWRMAKVMARTKPE